MALVGLVDYLDQVQTTAAPELNATTLHTLDGSGGNPF
jgi:hypothetical protein